MSVSEFEWVRESDLLHEVNLYHVDGEWVYHEAMNPCGWVAAEKDTLVEVRQ